MDLSDDFMYFSDMDLDALQYRIVRAAKTWCPPDWRWVNVPEQHGWRGYTLWLVAEGAGRLRMGQDDYALSAGDLFVLRMGQPLVAEHDRAHPLVVPWVHFEVEPALAGRAGESDFPLGIYRRISGMGFVLELYDRLLDAWAPGRVRQDEVVLWLRALLCEVAHQDGIAGTGDGLAAKIDGICREIKMRPGGNYRMRDLSARMHCSEDHFIRLFAQHTGMTPGEYTIRCRVESAKSLLGYSNMTLSGIAEHLGYCDVFFFSKQFKRYTGLSPSVYRRRQEAARRSAAPL